MDIINKLKTLTMGTVDAGKSRVSRVRDHQRRKALLLELGELTYRKHQGDPIDGSATAPILAELDGIGADAEASDGSGDDE